MRRFQRPTAVAALVAMLALAATLLAPAAHAQDFDQIVDDLQRSGYHIESGAEGSTSGFSDLVAKADRTDQTWYFVSLAGPVGEDYADALRDNVTPRGNVLVYFLDGDFAEVQLASGESESTERLALAPFDSDWNQPEDFMSDVIDEFGSLTGASSSSTTTSSGSTGDSDSSGGGFPWAVLAIPAALVGGVWFLGRRGKKREAEEDLETAQKIRAELQSEIDELANDVLVLSGPTDLSDNEQAITYYREATDTYLDIADQLPDLDELEDANLEELSELGARVANARWQMDAAEAIMDGDPIPEKPKVEAPPAPERTTRPPAQQRQSLPQRQPRPRVQYSPSRRRSGGGLLDVLIAGAGMMGRSRGGTFGGGRRSGGMMFPTGGSNRRGGGMFGGGSRSGTSTRRTSTPRRPSGGVFGGGGGSRSSRSSSRSRPSSRSSSSRSRSRSTGRRSTSRRRPRNTR